MPLVIKDKSYAMPNESGQKGPTGKEIIELENYFQLDGLLILTSLASDNPPVGYTKIKGMYSLAWICLTRAGEVVSLEDVLNDYSLDDFDFQEEAETKKPEAVG
jgi:hypothetical protein